MTTNSFDKREYRIHVKWRFGTEDVDIIDAESAEDAIRIWAESYFKSELNDIEYIKVFVLTVDPVEVSWREIIA